MSGKRFLLIFFSTAILVAGLAAWLGMRGLAARDIAKSREAEATSRKTTTSTANP